MTDEPNEDNVVTPMRGSQDLLTPKPREYKVAIGINQINSLAAKGWRAASAWGVGIEVLALMEAP